MSKDRVDLGFVTEDFDPWEVESRHFPSKVGGKPAWLDLGNLPKPEILKCSKCGKPTTFLLQVYSPDSSQVQAFHRSIFLFLCTSSQCWQEGEPPLLVLRSQLSRYNSYYPEEPPKDEAGWRTDISASAHSTLCPVCGCKGDKSCARCKGVSYCSESHQRVDWKAGHKQVCKEGYRHQGGSADVRCLLKESLIIEEEEPDKVKDPESPEDVEKYRHLLEGGGVEAAPQELEEIEAGQVEDETYNKFKQRQSRAPDQILRYHRGGKPLLCTAKPVLDSPTPCSLCREDRTFEIQVMPQLLSALGLGLEPTDGGLDWASLYIYTCSKSCEITGYVKEEIQLRNFERSNLPGS